MLGKLKKTSPGRALEIQGGPAIGYPNFILTNRISAALVK